MSFSILTLRRSSFRRDLPEIRDARAAVLAAVPSKQLFVRCASVPE
jgi:hypothetical protein